MEEKGGSRPAGTRASYSSPADCVPKGVAFRPILPPSRLRVTFRGRHAFSPADRRNAGPPASAPARTDRGSLDFDAFFRRVYPSLHRYALRMAGDADAADDIAQEAFTRLLGRSMPEDEARLWLFTVAANLFRDRARMTKRRARILSTVPRDETSPWPRPDERAERADDVARVRRALERIPERDRQMLLMRHEGFRYDEIARAVDVAPTSVGTLLARALRRFSAAMDAHEEDES